MGGSRWEEEDELLELELEIEEEEDSSSLRPLPCKGTMGASQPRFITARTG
jgi:hypothetical protein